MRFGCALGEIYGPDRKFGLWGRSGGWHILQGRKDNRWAAVQSAVYGQLRGALTMGVDHMQTSVAAAARRRWVATVDSTATSRGVRGEPGRPADINSAVGNRRKPQHCKDRLAARATEGARESSFFGPAVPSTRRHNWYFAAATPGGRLSTRRGAVGQAAGMAATLGVME